MPSDAVAKKSSTDVGDSVEYEHHEQSSKASASAGLNLNVLGALGGVFSSKSSKDTDDVDDSVTERKKEHSAVKGEVDSDVIVLHLADALPGVAAGNLGASAAANAEQKAKATRAQIQDK
ncbi:hypothetical protein LTR95_006568 [Oleoguttula sp. CCFEE 5521]